MSGAAPPSPTNKPDTTQQEGATRAAQYRHGEKGLLLAVAGIAAITGILGATVGGYFAYKGANLQSQATANVARMQSHAAAVLAERVERKETYAKYRKGLDDLLSQEFMVGNIFKGFKNTPDVSEELRTQVKNFNDRWDEWSRLEDDLALVGSPDVIAVDSQVINTVNRTQSLLYGIRDALLGSGPRTAVNNISAFNDAVEKANNLSIKFLQVAKKDLETLGYGDH
jgi:hypothetical protein